MKWHFSFVSLFIILNYETGVLNAGQMTLMNTLINSSPTKMSSFSINMKRPIHVVSDKFLSLTVDPNTLIHMADCDTTDATANMARSLSPAYIRVSGPESNEYYFQASQHDQIFSEYLTRRERQNESKNHTITGTQWVALNNFISKTGLNMIVALNGAMENKDNLWDLSNPLDLITFSDRMKYNLDFALGYEVEGGEDKGREIGRNVQRLRKVLEAFPRYHNSLIVGPDMTSFETRHDVSFIRKYLTEAGDALSAFTWHPEFSKLKKNDDAYELLSNTLNQLDNYIWMKDGIFKPISKTIPRKAIWIAESEHKEKEGTFSDALTSLTRLGSAAKLGITVFMKKPHLLSLYEPTSEYWISLLHKSLTGRNVLDVKAVNGNYTQLHVYGHCTNIRENPDDGVIDPSLAYEKGAVTVFGVNMANERARLNLKFGLRSDETVHEYIITEEVDRSGLRNTFLNGQELRLSKDDELPMLHPRIKTSSKYLSVPARSAFFIVFPNMKARVCTFNTEEIEIKIKNKLNSILQEPEDVETEENIEFDVMGEETSHESSFVTFPRRKQNEPKWKDEKKITEPIVKYVTFTDDSWLSSFPKTLSKKSDEEKFFSSEEETNMKNHKNITKELELLDEHTSHRCTDEEVKSNKCTKRYRRSMKYDFDDDEDTISEQLLEDYFDDDSEYYPPSLFDNLKTETKEIDVDNNLKHDKESLEKNMDLDQGVELIIVKANYPKIRKENAKSKYNAKSEDFQGMSRQKRDDTVAKYYEDDSLEGTHEETATSGIVQNTDTLANARVLEEDVTATEYPGGIVSKMQVLEGKIANTEGLDLLSNGPVTEQGGFEENNPTPTKTGGEIVGMVMPKIVSSTINSDSTSQANFVIGMNGEQMLSAVVDDAVKSSPESPNNLEMTSEVAIDTTPATLDQGIVSQSVDKTERAAMELPTDVESRQADSVTGAKPLVETTSEFQRDCKNTTESVIENTTTLKRTRGVQTSTLESEIESKRTEKRLIVSPFSKKHSLLQNTGKSAEEKVVILGSTNQDTQLGKTGNDEVVASHKEVTETLSKHDEIAKALQSKKIEDTNKKQEKNVKQGKKELKAMTAAELTEKYRTKLQELQERYKSKLEELKKKLQKQTTGKTDSRIKREIEKSELLEKINKKLQEIKENYESRQENLKQKIEDLTHAMKSKKVKRSVESDLKGNLDAVLEKVKEKMKTSQENRANRREEINKMRKERQRTRKNKTLQEERPKRHIKNNEINSFKSKYENNLHNDDNSIYFDAEDAIEITNELYGNDNSLNRIERSLNNYILREDYENEIIPEEDINVKIYKKKFHKPEIETPLAVEMEVNESTSNLNSKTPLPSVTHEIDTSEELTSSVSPSIVSTPDDFSTTTTESEVRKDFITTVIRHANSLLMYFRYLMNL